MVSAHARGLPNQGDRVGLQTGPQAAALHYFHNAGRPPLAFLHSQHLDRWSERSKFAFLSFKLAIVFLSLFPEFIEPEEMLTARCLFPDSSVSCSRLACKGKCLQTMPAA